MHQSSGCPILNVLEKVASYNAEPHVLSNMIVLQLHMLDMLNWPSLEQEGIKLNALCFIKLINNLVRLLISIITYS